MGPPILQLTVNFLLRFWICFRLSAARCGCGRRPRHALLQPPRDGLRSLAAGRKGPETGGKSPAEMPGGRRVSSFSMRWNIFDRLVFCGPSRRCRKTPAGPVRTRVFAAKFAFCGFCCGVFRVAHKGPVRSRFGRVPDLSAGFPSVLLRSSGATGHGWRPIWPVEAGFRRRAAARRLCSPPGGGFSEKKVSDGSLIPSAAGNGGRRAEKLLASKMKSFPAPRAIRLTGPAGSRNLDPSQGKGGGWRGSGRRRPQILEDDDGAGVGHMAPETSRRDRERSRPTTEPRRSCLTSP